MFMTVKQSSEKWGISDRRIRVLCTEGKIPGAYREGRAWKIPIDADKPADGRYKARKAFSCKLTEKKGARQPQTSDPRGIGAAE